MLSLTAMKKPVIIFSDMLALKEDSYFCYLSCAYISTTRIFQTVNLLFLHLSNKYYAVYIK